MAGAQDRVAAVRTPPGTAMKVVVTGAGGMLAQAVLPALERGGHEVLALTRADADVTRLETLMHPVRLFRPDWIFHLAAFTRVDDCEADPDRAYRVNGLGARNAALAAAASGAAVLAVSTDYVFDGVGHAPYREYDPIGPRTVYGRSKWAGEQSVREVNPKHVVVRTAWLYGRGGTNFVDTILRKARGGEPLKVVDDQHGSPTWTEDLAAGLIELAARGEHGTYHVTNAGECSWFELAGFALECAGVETTLERTTTDVLARPAPRPLYSVLNNLCFEQVTGSRLPHWRDAVRRYVEARTASDSSGATAQAESR